MQRVSYEDSGIHVDTRGQTTGTVTIKSQNDAPCNVSIPGGLLSGFAGGFQDLFARSLRLDLQLRPDAGNYSITTTSPTIQWCSATSGTYNFEMNECADTKVLIIVKEKTGCAVSLIDTIRLDGPGKDGNGNINNPLEGKAGLIFCVCRAGGTVGTVEPLWFCMPVSFDP